MSKEIQSLITWTNRKGDTKSLYMTERDVEFVKFAARWWCVSPDHFIRASQNKEVWSHAYTDSKESDWRDRQVFSLTRRMNKFAKLDSYSPLHVARFSRDSLAYWCTPWGGDLIGAPWTKYPVGNITRAAHAWAACDIGMDLERRGYTVYSEREFSNGHTVGSVPVLGGKFLSALDDSQSSNKEHGVRPDLAIVGGDESDSKFIFVEVERASGRSPAKYKQKLMNYYMHDRVEAVWYVTDQQDTAERIKRVDAELSGVSRDMPVRVLRMNKGSYNYSYSDAFGNEICMSDLHRVGAVKGVSNV